MADVLVLKSQLARMGGAEKYALRIAQAFGANHAVTILTSGAAIDTPLKIVTHESVSPFSFRRIQAFDRFCDTLVAELKPAVVFGLDRNRHQTHLRASNGVHAAYLEHRKAHDGFCKSMTFALNPLHRTLLKLEREAFEDAQLQKLYVNSDMVRREIMRFYRVSPQKVEVVHNGVEWEEMRSDFEKWPEARTSAPFHFLFIGHNYKRKGLGQLLAGLGLLKTRDFQLSVLGKEKNMGAFQAMARKLRLEKQVHFLGPRTDIRNFYQRGDALVIPSLYDPFANVTVEALAMGVFVVSSKTNGGCEVLSPATGAVIDDLNDPEAVAAALETAMRHPKTEKRAAAIRASVRHLDFALQLKKFIDI